MNLAFVGYEGLSRSQRVLSTFLDLLNSSYPAKAGFINCSLCRCDYRPTKSLSKDSRGLGERFTVQNSFEIYTF